MKKYNPKEIEPKWQEYWKANKTYVVDLNSKKPTYMASGMFNYTSGDGIHVGHAYTFTIPDVKARFKRQLGFESFNPVGWDSFGLPAENYAIKEGVSPQDSKARTIPYYRKQYTSMGWGVDWDKEIDSSEPAYYKWTQWIFSELYRNGLVYQDSRMQWWCEQCQTVLANEQVDANGKCWRHDKAPDPIIEKKEAKQWFFKITDYADELLEHTDDLNWTEGVKLAQKNWIGRSVGAEVKFKVKDSDEVIPVFTTRIDTLFSGAFIVLAPEHKLVNNLTIADKREEMKIYVKESSRKTEVERQANKDKSGVFTGSYAINPANGEEIPIWVGDFVLVGYGTGAVFGDIHDERDFEFLNKFNIPARVTVIPEDKEEAKKVLAKEYPYTDEGILIESGNFTGLKSAEAREKITAWLAKEGVAEEKVNYKMRDWSATRQRYWGAPTPIIYCERCGPVLVPDKDLPVVLPELDDFKPNGDGRSALARAKDWLIVKCPECGKNGERETDTLDTFIDSSWYLYRYIDPFNDKKIFNSELVNKWFPLDFYDGADHATAHLLYARFIGRFFHKIGLVDNPEPLGEMLYHGKILGEDGTNFSKSAGNGINPLEIIESGYGADALRTYLMFAAPFGQNISWNPQGVPATYRFLNRLWNLVQEYSEAKETKLNEELGNKLNQASHKMVKKVTEDIEAGRTNTAIAALMECMNDLTKLKSESFGKNEVWRSALESLVACVAPFAPHIAEELWQDLGHSSTVHIDTWPKWDEKYLVSDTIKIAVQVNGKLRAEIEVDASAQKDEILSLAKEDKKVATVIGDNQIKKEIYVAGKIVNLVI
jgi:leucyl-tRNA synthetase